MVKDQPTIVVINADEKVGHDTVASTMDLVQQIQNVKLGIAPKHR